MLKRWLTVFLLAFAAYAATLQTGYSWQDSGGFQFRAISFAGTAEEMLGLGLALAHPAYIALCALFSRLTAAFGNPALGVTLVSALGASVALANVWLIVCLFLTRRRGRVASLTVVLLGASHMFWWMATIAEVYTWCCAFLTAELLLLFAAARADGETRRGIFLTALAFVTGLYLSFHDFAFLTWPVYAAVVLAWICRRKLSALWLAPMAGAFCVGALPFLLLFVYVAVRSGVPAAVTSALFGDYAREVLGVSERWAGLFKANMALHALSYLNPLWLALPVGVWCAVRRKAGAAGVWLLAAAAIHFVFFVRYNVADQATFALPSLTLFALLAAVGLDRLVGERLCRAGRGAAVALLALAAAVPTLAYLGADLVIRRLHVAALEQKEKVPYRDEVRYWVRPWKMNERSAQDMVDAVLRETETNAVFLGYVVPLTPLMAKQAADPTAVGDRQFVSVENFGSYRRPSVEDCRRLIRTRPAYSMRQQDADAVGLPLVRERRGEFLRVTIFSDK